ncbi:hypothetical protein SNEBB_004181 [Seison nebaliae]|nr:hypothetical protein SNEBB_004181 [Seison nebaliae]
MYSDDNMDFTNHLIDHTMYGGVNDENMEMKKERKEKDLFEYDMVKWDLNALNENNNSSSRRCCPLSINYPNSNFHKLNKKSDGMTDSGQNGENCLKCSTKIGQFDELIKIVSSKRKFRSNCFGRKNETEISSSNFLDFLHDDSNEKDALNLNFNLECQRIHRLFFQLFIFVTLLLSLIVLGGRLYFIHQQNSSTNFQIQENLTISKRNFSFIRLLQEENINNYFHKKWKRNDDLSYYPLKLEDFIRKINSSKWNGDEKKLFQIPQTIDELDEKTTVLYYTKISIYISIIIVFILFVLFQHCHQDQCKYFNQFILVVIVFVVIFYYYILPLILQLFAMISLNEITRNFQNLPLDLNDYSNDSLSIRLTSENSFEKYSNEIIMKCHSINNNIIIAGTNYYIDQNQSFSKNHIGKIEKDIRYLWNNHHNRLIELLGKFINVNMLESVVDEKNLIIELNSLFALTILLVMIIHLFLSISSGTIVAHLLTLVSFFFHNLLSFLLIWLQQFAQNEQKRQTELFQFILQILREKFSVNLVLLRIHHSLHNYSPYFHWNGMKLNLKILLLTQIIIFFTIWIFVASLRQYFRRIFFQASFIQCRLTFDECQQKKLNKNIKNLNLLSDIYQQMTSNSTTVSTMQTELSQRTQLLRTMNCNKSNNSTTILNNRLNSINHQTISINRHDCSQRSKKNVRMNVGSIFSEKNKNCELYRSQTFLNAALHSKTTNDFQQLNNRNNGKLLQPSSSVLPKRNCTFNIHNSRSMHQILKNRDNRRIPESKTTMNRFSVYVPSEPLSVRLPLSSSTLESSDMMFKQVYHWKTNEYDSSIFIRCKFDSLNLIFSNLDNKKSLKILDLYLYVLMNLIEYHGMEMIEWNDDTITLRLCIGDEDEFNGTSTHSIDQLCNKFVKSIFFCQCLIKFIQKLNQKYNSNLVTFFAISTDFPRETNHQFDDVSDELRWLLENCIENKIHLIISLYQQYISTKFHSSLENLFNFYIFSSDHLNNQLISIQFEVNFFTNDPSPMIDNLDNNNNNTNKHNTSTTLMELSTDTIFLSSSPTSTNHKSISNQTNRSLSTELKRNQTNRSNRRNIRSSSCVNNASINKRKNPKNMMEKLKTTQINNSMIDEDHNWIHLLNVESNNLLKCLIEQNLSTLTNSNKNGIFMNYLLTPFHLMKTASSLTLTGKQNCLTTYKTQSLFRRSIENKLNFFSLKFSNNDIENEYEIYRRKNRNSPMINLKYLWFITIFLICMESVLFLLIIYLNDMSMKLIIFERSTILFLILIHILFLFIINRCVCLKRKVNECKLSSNNNNRFPSYLYSNLKNDKSGELSSSSSSSAELISIDHKESTINLIKSNNSKTSRCDNIKWNLLHHITLLIVFYLIGTYIIPSSMENYCNFTRLKMGRNESENCWNNLKLISEIFHPFISIKTVMDYLRNYQIILYIPLIFSLFTIPFYLLKWIHSIILSTFFFFSILTVYSIDIFWSLNPLAQTDQYYLNLKKINIISIQFIVGCWLMISLFFYVIKWLNRIYFINNYQLNSNIEKHSYFNKTNVDYMIKEQLLPKRIFKYFLNALNRTNDDDFQDYNELIRKPEIIEECQLPYHSIHNEIALGKIRCVLSNDLKKNIHLTKCQIISLVNDLLKPESRFNGIRPYFFNDSSSNMMEITFFNEVHTPIKYNNVHEHNRHLSSSMAQLIEFVFVLKESLNEKKFSGNIQFHSALHMGYVVEVAVLNKTNDMTLFTNQPLQLWGHGIYALNNLLLNCNSQCCLVSPNVVHLLSNSNYNFKSVGSLILINGCITQIYELVGRCTDEHPKFEGNATFVAKVPLQFSRLLSKEDALKELKPVKELARSLSSTNVFTSSSTSSMLMRRVAKSPKKLTKSKRNINSAKSKPKSKRSTSNKTNSSNKKKKEEKFEEKKTSRPPTNKPKIISNDEKVEQLLDTLQCIQAKLETTYDKVLPAHENKKNEPKVFPSKTPSNDLFIDEEKLKTNQSNNSVKFEKSLINFSNDTYKKLSMNNNNNSRRQSSLIATTSSSSFLRCEKKLSMIDSKAAIQSTHQMNKNDTKNPFHRLAHHSVSSYKHPRRCSIIDGKRILVSPYVSAESMLSSSSSSESGYHNIPYDYLKNRTKTNSTDSATLLTMNESNIDSPPESTNSNCTSNSFRMDKSSNDRRNVKQEFIPLITKLQQDLYSLNENLFNEKYDNMDRSSSQVTPNPSQSNKESEYDNILMN